MSICAHDACRTHRWIGRCVACVVAILVGGTTAWALDNGVQREGAVMTSPAAPNRQALILAPSPGGGGVASDAEAYRSTLRLLGFDVTTIVADSRPELDGNLRRFSSGVPADAEVLVLALGTVLGRGKNLYLTSASPTADLLRRPELYDTEGVALADPLRRILQRGPKEVIVLVDSCRTGEGSTDCKLGASSLPDGVSAIVAYHAKRNDGGAPTARLATLRPDAIAMMYQPGLSFFGFYDALSRRLRDTDMQLATTASLSRTFVFLPNDFLARLPTPCNEVEATTDERRLRTQPVDPLVSACQTAAQTYSFSPHFASKLLIAREQAAFHAAVFSCGDLAPADHYLRTYATGRYRSAVERHKETCAAMRRAIEERQWQVRPQVSQAQPSAPRLIPRDGQPASFPCQPFMSEPVAELICADRELAAADYRLGIAYRNAVAMRAPAARRAFYAEERDWLRKRNLICGIPLSGQWSTSELTRFKLCLLREIEARTREIER